MTGTVKEYLTPAAPAGVRGGAVRAGFGHWPRPRLGYGPEKADGRAAARPILPVGSRARRAMAPAPVFREGA